MQQQFLQVMIRNREKIIFQDAAKAVSSVNDKGVFDILPQHINFITMIKDNLIIHKPDNTVQTYKIRSGLMRVNNNTIEIYVGIMEPQR